MNRVLSTIAVPVISILCVASLSACGVASGPGGGVAETLATLKPLADDCDGEINAYAGLDASATGRGDPTLMSERLAALRDLGDQVAACGGYMKVVAFSSSAAETFTLGSAAFPAGAGTETARLIDAREREEDLLAGVEEALPQAMRELDPNGTDVLAQLTLALQMKEQRPQGRLYVQLATDGINTTRPVAMATPSFTEEAARTAAERVKMPSLNGSFVRILGIGQAKGEKRPSTARIAVLTTFYELACARTGADCLITTDYTTGG